MYSSIKRRVACMLLALTMVLSCFAVFSPVNVFAEDNGPQASDSFKELMATVYSGKLSAAEGGLDFTMATYKRKEGDFYIWTDLFNDTWMRDTNGAVTASASATLFNSNKIDELKQSQKQKFIENVIALANAKCYYEENKGMAGNGITSDTVNMLLEKIQNECGMGSEVLAAVLNDTQPDYVSAGKIWQPFSGPVSTLIGVLAIAMMSLLGVTMALDIFYVCVPAFQMVLDGDTEAGQQSSTSQGLSKIVSKAARDAVKETQGGSGNADTKSQIGTYFKKRWKELFVVGFCLLYLVQGQIWSLVSWIVNLVSGVLD